MKTIVGKSVCKGIAIGPIWEYKSGYSKVKKIETDDIQAQLRKLSDACIVAKEELTSLYERACDEVGREHAQIFNIHKLIIDDSEYIDPIINMITEEKVSAEYAVKACTEACAQKFALIDDEYMKERVADIRDISDRIIKILMNHKTETWKQTVPSIVIADDLAPSQTIQLDRKYVIAFVTRKGSVNSHTAIIARTMNIPALVNTPLGSDNGKMAIVDGDNGLFIIEPDEETLKRYQEKKNKQLKENEELLKLADKKAVTKDGREIELYANIGEAADAATASYYKADGIGLFRSEFLYLQNDNYPNEDLQFNAYKEVVELMKGKPVVIRTLDIGADKQIGYFGLKEEDNPAMGYRAVRICLTREEIFKTQLRAILRAGAYGHVSVMIPMITSEWEVDRVKEILADVKKDMSKDGIKYGDVKLGIMIETPAAVMIAEELAKKVDFFSIGTNDLTQYTLAIDRQNEELDKFFDAHHPAVMKMISMVVKAAHQAHISCCICGELGADTSLTKNWLDLGIDKLSVSPNMILHVKKRILEL